jgi:hypothetical protein
VERVESSGDCDEEEEEEERGRKEEAHIDAATNTAANSGTSSKGSV